MTHEKVLESIDYAWMQHDADSGLYGPLSKHPKFDRDEAHVAMEEEQERIAYYDYHKSGQADIDEYFLKHEKPLEDEQVGDIDFTPWGVKEKVPEWKKSTDRITTLLS